MADSDALAGMRQLDRLGWIEESRGQYIPAPVDSWRTPGWRIARYALIDPESPPIRPAADLSLRKPPRVKDLVTDNILLTAGDPGQLDPMCNACLSRK